MTDTVVAPPTRSPVGDHPEHPDPRRRSQTWLRPGWPLAAIFVPFPIWWALGLSEYICLIMAVPMALALCRKTRLRTPKRFGWWLLFLAWVLVGVVVLQVDAVGAVADSSKTRYLTWGYRAAWYAAVTVAGLYVVNMRREFPTVRVARILSWGFLSVVAGGLLGVIAPQFQFSSLLELVLPQGLASNGFVMHMIHPSAAQLQTVLGYEAPRPSAPYSYTNIWGLNYACFLPFFVYAWWAKGDRIRRVLAPVILLVSAVPVIYSINRGLWGALAVVAVFLTVRAALQGRPGVLGAAVLASGVVVALLAWTSLGGIVTDRFSSEGSEQGRTNLGTLAVESVTATSPVIGLGSTRNVQGNFNTITGGATPNCPRCAPPALGTQGQLWLVIYSQGLVGLAFYLLFFGLNFLGNVRRRSTEATLGLSVLLVSFVTMPVYNALGTALMTVMIAVAILAREPDHPRPAEQAEPRLPLLNQYFEPLRHQRALVGGCLCAGLLIGGVWQRGFGTPYIATTTILVPPSSKYPSSNFGPMTMDTQAQMLGSAEVAAAFREATGETLAPDQTALQVKAKPNSRIMHISYKGESPAQAKVGAVAATQAFLNVRGGQLREDRASQFAQLRSQALTLDQAVSQINGVLDDLDQPKDGVPLVATYNLRQKRTTLLTEIHQVDRQFAKTAGSAITPGGPILAPQVRPVMDVWRLSLASSLMIALLGAVGASRWIERDGPRLGRSRSLMRETGLPMIGRIASGRRRFQVLWRRGRAASATETWSGLSYFGPVTFVAADAKDRELVAAVRQLNHQRPVNQIGPQSGSSARAVLVARPRTRGGAVLRARHRVHQLGATAVGIVLLS